MCARCSATTDRPELGHAAVNRGPGSFSLCFRTSSRVSVRLTLLQIFEAVVQREQLLLIPNVADRKRILVQMLRRNNVTLR